MNGPHDDKKAFLSECISSVFVSGDTVKMDFIWLGPAPKAGQFFLIKPKRTGVFLARPLSAAGWKPKVASGKYAQKERRVNIDRRLLSNRYMSPKMRLLTNRRINTDRRRNSGSILSFIVIRRGQGSREIMDMRPGEEAVLIGPLGNSWAEMEISPDSSGNKRTGPIALIAGGTGIAPLLAFTQELGEATYDFYAGFRTGSYGLEKIKPKSLIISTEDGSQGLKGRITDFFTPSGYSAVYACGPEPMLKAAGDACIAGDIPCFISMERNMACGVGACLGCTLKTTKGLKHCCSDGPIFKAEEVCFDD